MPMPLLKTFATHIFCVLGLAVLALLGGCGHFADRGTAYTATSTVKLDPALSEGAARLEAQATAEREARDQILAQAAQLQLSDGRKLQDLAISDPYVRASLDDTVRAAQIRDKRFNDDGTVTVTVRMELSPLYKMIADYPKHAIN
jgi:hypothetical protein